MRYREKRGSLNLGLRVEVAAATLATTYLNTRRKDLPPLEIHHFAPHVDPPGEQELTLDELKTWA